MKTYVAKLTLRKKGKIVWKKTIEGRSRKNLAELCESALKKIYPRH